MLFEDKKAFWQELVVLIFAVDAIMVIWFRGSIFGMSRAYAQAWSESQTWWKWLIGELFSCPVCLPLHIGLWLFLVGSFLSCGKIILSIISAGGLASRLYNDVWRRPPGS